MMDVIQAVSSVGFPIVLSLYLVLKFEKTLYNNTEALKDLKSLIRERLR